MTCPFCDSDQYELISQFGSQLLLAQYRCRACKTYFEGLRPEEFEPSTDSPVAAPLLPHAVTQPQMGVEGVSPDSGRQRAARQQGQLPYE